LKLTIIRGVPGSGKSTIAKTIDAIQVEADQFAIDHFGEYYWDIKKSGIYHKKCFELCEKLLSENKNVVCSNTFITNKSILPYLELAKQHNADFEVIEAKGNFKSIHVSIQIVNRMRDKYEEFNLY